MSNNNPSFDEERERERAWKRQIAENIDKGESIYAVYKGEGFQRLTGKTSDTESLATGHFDGLTNVTLNIIRTTEHGLNFLSNLPPDLVPIVKKIRKKDIKQDDILYKKGSLIQVFVTDKSEAEKQAKMYGYEYKEIEGKFFFKYPGLVMDNRLMEDFIYGIARASGSLGGETKIQGLASLSTMHAVPNFNTGAMGSQWGEPEEEDDEEE